MITSKKDRYSGLIVGMGCALFLLMTACTNEKSKRTVRSPNPSGAVETNTKGKVGAESKSNESTSSTASGTTGDAVPCNGPPLTLEVMVGTDAAMSEKYGDRVGCVVKEIMAQVNYIYRKLCPEININVVLVRHEVNVDKHGLTLSRDGLTMLGAWNTWALSQNNPPDGSPNHFDYALLLSSTDFGYGLSPSPAQMCTRGNGAINREEGYASAKLVAHEMGHCFGLGHDTETGMLMNPTPGTIWSSEKKQQMKQILTENNSCMQNKVPSPAYTGIPLITYDQQCQGLFGSDTCMLWGGTECSKLLCKHPSDASQCVWDASMPLDGTNCGEGNWCFEGKCVEKPVNNPSTLFDGCKI